MSPGSTWSATQLDSDALMSAPYRAADVSGWVDTVARLRHSLLLCGDDEALLDQCAQALMSSLRVAESVETTVLLDIDRDLLLERFNRLLARFTVDQARQRASDVARVWVLHVQSSSEIALARLLLRLTHDLPAAGVSVVLLAPLAVAREIAPEGKGRKLQVQAIAAPWSNTAPGAADAGERIDPPLGPAATARAAPQPPAVTESVVGQRRPLHRPTVLAGIALLMASAAAVVYLQPIKAADSARVAEPAGRTPGATDNASSAPLAAVQPLTPPAAASQPPALPADPQALAPGSPPSAAERTGSSESPVVNTGQVAVRGPANGEGRGGQTQAPPPASAIENTRDQVARTRGWIDAQPSETWIVQHRVSASAAGLLELRTRHGSLRDARVIALFRSDGRLFYALVSGPFDSAADARSFIKNGPDIGRTPWVRSVASMKKEMDDQGGRLRTSPLGDAD